MSSKVLTGMQEQVLRLLFEKGLGERGYYLTGGTALSEFYLQHRYSDDLDLFTREIKAPDADFPDMRNWLISSGFTITNAQLQPEFVRFFVRQEKESEDALKIELARDAGAMLAPPLRIDKMIVDSFEDISVNKICAIYGRMPPEVKDFCDLHFILNTSGFSIEYLLARARENQADFDTEEGRLTFAVNLMSAREFRHLPRMLKPLSLDELRERLEPLALEIIRSLRPTGHDTA